MSALETLVDSLGTSGITTSTTTTTSSTTTSSNDAVENAKACNKDETSEKNSVGPNNLATDREMLYKSEGTDSPSVTSNDTDELVPGKVIKNILQTTIKHTADHRSDGLNTGKNETESLPPNRTGMFGAKASDFLDCSKQTNSDSQSNAYESTLRPGESAMLEPCLETPPPKLSDSDTNSDHPMTLLKCELQLDEDSTNPDETKLHVPEMSWMDGLEKIDKEEIDVASDLGNNVAEESFEDIQSFDTLARDDASTFKHLGFTNISKSGYANNTKGELQTDSFHSQGNTLDSFNNRSLALFDTSSKKHRRSSADPSSARYSKASLFTSPSALLAAAAAAVSQFTSNSTSTSTFLNVNNTTQNAVPPSQSSVTHVDTKRPALNKHKSVQLSDKTVCNPDRNTYDDSDEISIINDTMSSEGADSVLLLPDCPDFLLTSPAPSQDVFPSSFFSLSGSPQYSLQSVGLVQGGGGGAVAGSSMGGPSPSRQSCCCPLCGRHIAQRRSLKQHLMSNFHKLSAIEADFTIRRCPNSYRR